MNTIYTIQKSVVARKRGSLLGRSLFALFGPLTERYQRSGSFKRSFSACLLVAIFLLLGNSAAYAVLKTSTGSGSWTTAATWSPSGVPAAGDDVVILTGHTVTLPTSGTFPASGSYGSLTLDGTLSRGTRSMTFGSLTGSGTIASTGTTIGGFNIGSDNTSTTFAGIFTGSIGSGVAFNKYGTGTLTLTGASNYTGAGTSYIFAGTLRLGAHECLPNSAKLRLENGGSATFDLNGYNETIAVLHAPNTVEYLSDAVVTNSSVNLSTLTLSLAPSGVALGECYGTISGNLNLVVGSSTAGTFAYMQLRGNNTYTGTTTVVGNGQLQISCLDPEVDGCTASLASSQVTIDGAGAKMTFLQPTTLTCNLSILNGGIAELYQPTTCYSLTLDGVAQPDGTTYGSTSSNANNQDDTHFSDIGGGALTVCSPPSSPSVGSNSPICAGTDLNLTCSAASGTTPFTYSWNGPNGFSSTDQNPTITAATTAATGTYYVTITNSCGSINTSTIVTVSQPAMPTLACYETASF
ncbi:MAG TPA: hypothetical protein DCF44_03500, partial [Chitinophagaceae bacterium]|nr:hypothetical protein [Chitinophagaceae bacterium]